MFQVIPGSIKEGGDFSGFSREDWPLRNGTIHKRYAEKVKRPSTKTTHEKLATQYGMAVIILFY